MITSRSAAALGCMAAAVLAAPACFAQAPGWYAGGGIGRSAATIDDDRINRGLAGQGLATTGIDDRDSDTGYKLFGGYQWNRNFGIEGGWFDLGQMGFTATTAPPGTLTGDVKLQGLNLDLVGTLPLTDRFSLLGRIGAAYVRTRGTFAAEGGVAMPYRSTSTSERELGFKFGAGVSWRFSDAWELRAEGERYRVNDSVGKIGDVDLLSVSVVYRFGAAAPVARAPAPMAAPVAAAPAPPQPVAPQPVPPTPAPAVVPAAPAPVTVHFEADALFDFDRSTLKAAGSRQLDTFANDLRDVRYSDIRVVGHTDRLGAAAYNEGLSRRRADAVATYLVQAGLPAGRVTSRGAGETEPVTATTDCRGNVATPALIACLQPDRRVEVQVDGMRRDGP